MCGYTVHDASNAGSFHCPALYLASYAHKEQADKADKNWQGYEISRKTADVFFNLIEFHRTLQLPLPSFRSLPLVLPRPLPRPVLTTHALGALSPRRRLAVSHSIFFF
ncbi:hypothetical protein G6O67_005795 [Ophiocordyceps sinensis]|uniref:Uncharacterized protein n=1 Tax=Ophiocordyceps sinensis TaxID=72228 RepID=A0A8H4PLR6_9HYPO|nr:hypothetical protein G6O67_005795 [Ophiocordyceps sinensis]